NPLAEQSSALCRRDAPRAASREPAGRDSLAGKAETKYSRKLLVSRHGLRRACAGHRGLSASWLATDHGWRPSQSAGHLLPAWLLDVVERGQTRAVARIQQRDLVP